MPSRPRDAHYLPVLVGLLVSACAHAPTSEERRYVQDIAPEIQHAADEIIAQVGDARVIGLGEASHGEAITREVQLAALKQAVLELGCRAVVIEGRFTDETYWNDWVHERGRRAQAPIEQFAWALPKQWADTYEWLRQVDGDIEVIGTDPCVSRRACLSTIIDRLARHAPDSAASLRAWTKLDEDELLARFAEWRVPASVPEHERATLERIRALTQESSLDQEIRGKVIDSRERVMADNVMWALGRTPSCVVVLAHDGHTDVEDGTNPKYPWWLRTRPMGGHLRERLGNDYVAVHFALGRGRISAYRIVGGLLLTSHLRRAPPQQLFELSPIVPGSLEHRLSDEAAIAVVPAVKLPEETFTREIPFAWNRRAARKGVDWHLKRRSAFDIVVYVPRAVPMEPLGG